VSPSPSSRRRASRHIFEVASWPRRSRSDVEPAPTPDGGAVSLRLMQEIDVQTVVFREGEHYVAQCLDVDVSSFGDSEDDALTNLREALELYFEDAPADSVAKVEGPEVRRLTLERA
jgi:predicted RNase H-like HicB family nuclease